MMTVMILPGLLLVVATCIHGEILPNYVIEERGIPISGRPFALACVVQKNFANNNNKYTWHRGHKEIEGQTGMLLRFASLREEDAGEYVCTVKEGDEETTSTPHRLIPMVPPVVHMEPTSPNSVVKGILGKELTLTCNVTKAIPPVPDDGYSWSYLPFPMGMSRPLVGNARTLTLGPLTKKDDGQYSCTASNGQNFRDPPNFTRNTSVTVDVVYIEKVFLTNYTEVNEGNTIALTCEVDSHPPARLAWIVNGQEVRHVTDNLDHYVILHASCSDSATYTCGASNADLPGLVRNATMQLRVRCSNDGAKNKGSWFTVYEGPDAKVGKRFNLSCHLTGRGHASIPLPASYEWRKNDEILPEETRNVLIFKNVTSQDAGYYQCGPTHDSINMPRFFLHVSGDVLPMPDIFQQGVPISGRPFALTCTILRSYVNSKTRYTWYKDHVQIEGQTDMLLSFDNLTEEDTSDYVCMAREEPGESKSLPSRVYHLTPLVSPVVHMEPTFPNSVVKGILGKALTLTCNVTKGIPPVPDDGYSWSFLPQNTEMSRPRVENARTLTLRPLTRDDNGQYFCTASSGQYLRDPPDLRGNASVMVEIVYLENISLNSEKEMNESEDVTLTCKVDSHPPARLVWIVNGREVHHVTDNLDRYVILNASCSDSATYTCGASNADLPGLVRNATVQLRVPCKEDIAEDQTTQTRVRETPGQTDQNDKTALTTTIIVLAVLLVLILVLAALAVMYCRRQDGGTAWLRSVWRTLGRQTPRSPASKRHDSEDMELGEFPTEEKSLIESPNSSGLRKRKAKGRNTSEEETKPQFEGRNTALLQGQKVQFDKTYVEGVVYVFPPLGKSQTRQQARQDDVITVEDQENLEEESKACVVQLLYKELLRLDVSSPAFIFSQTMRDSVSFVIYHLTKGVVIVHVDETTDPEASSTFERATTLLEEMKDRKMEELQGQLVPITITLLLALPNVTNTKNSRLETQLKTVKDIHDIHALCGRRATDYKTWLWHLPVYANAWGSNEELHRSFFMAVSRYLRVKCFRDPRTWTEPSPEAPSGWLVTPEQAGVLHRADRLLHLYGPPGSGKTMLLVDRARQWLRQGSHVIVAVGSSRLELLLDSLGRWTLHGMPSEKVHKLMLCRDAEMFKKAIRDLRQHHERPEDICIVLDEASSDFLSSALDVLKSEIVSCLWTARHTDLTDAEARRFQELKGQSVFLERSVRCPRDVVDLAKLLKDGLPPPHMAVHPAVQDLPTPPVQAVFHASHAIDASFGPPPSRSGQLGSLARRLFGQAPSTFVCDNCEDWLRSSMSPLVNGLSLDDEQWRRWVILLTGDWGSDNALTGRLVDWLRRHGIPAVLEWQPDNETSNLRLCNLLGLERDQKSSTNYRRAVTRARVASGEDDKGCPAVHVIQASHCKGLDRPCVLAVHYDWRDDHPDHQSQARRESRLSQHREQLFRAVTRCQEELCVCFLSPSPAASLFRQLRPKP